MKSLSAFTFLVSGLVSCRAASLICMVMSTVLDAGGFLAVTSQGTHPRSPAVP
jgi:hypothetical protein